MKKRVYWLGTCLGIMLVAALLVTGCAQPAPATQAPSAPTPTATTPATAAPTVKPIVLRFAMPTPPTSSTEISHQWMFEQVEKRTNGRVKTEFFWAGTLLGNMDMVSGVGGGTADVGYTNLAYFPSELPHWQVSGTIILGGTNPLAAAMQVQTLYERVPALEADMRKWNLTAIRCPLATAPQIISKTPMNTLDSLKGKKLRSAGTAQTKVLEAVGAVPVFISSTEMYDAVAKGIIVGGMMSLDAMPKYHLEEVTKYWNEWGFMPGYFTGNFMNLDTWNRLPKEYQQVILQAGKDANVYLADLLKANESKVWSVLKAAGIQRLEASKAEIDKWANLPAVKALGTDWVKEMEAKGYPAAKDIYDLWVKLVAEAQ